MGSVPTELSGELSRLEQIFTVDQKKLKEITERFIEELEDGLRVDGSNIPMNLTWVYGLPTGKERGTFLTLDMGGTNLRVCRIVLSDQPGEHDMTQSQYRMPDDLKTGTAEKLWEYIAESLQKFLEEHDTGESTVRSPLPLAFCFSYPATQDRIDHGVLQTWTKGLDIKGVEGNDVVAQLREALEKRQLPIELVALANDTTGALMASAYTDPATIIGAVFGTGCNAAYVEDCQAISKAGDLPSDKRMAINCEYGAFDNAHRVLPRTEFDEQIDKESPRPGEQTFEKMSAGHYLGEIFRLVLLGLSEKGLIFKDKDSKLGQSYVLDTSFLSAIENDDLKSLVELFQEKLNLDPTESELQFCRRLAELIAIRGARLSACGVAAICKKRGIKKGHVAADGSVVNKHPHFKKRWSQALGEILDWPEEQRGELDEDAAGPIRLTSAEDGSGVGVAVIAAMVREGNRR